MGREKVGLTPSLLFHSRRVLLLMERNDSSRGSSWDVMGGHGTYRGISAWDVMGGHGTSWDIVGGGGTYRGMSWDVMGGHGTSWDIMVGYRGISRDVIGGHIVGSHGM